LTIALSGTNPSFTNFGSVSVPAGRTLTVTGAPLLNTGIGILGGLGTLVADVTGDGATFVTTGRFTIVGSYALSPGGTLRAQINGPTPGTQYGQLAVNGPVALAGPLSVTLGYAAAVNDTFTLIDNVGAGAVAGAFAGLPQSATLPRNGQPL